MRLYRGESFLTYFDCHAVEDNWPAACEAETIIWDPMPLCAKHARQLVFDLMKALVGDAHERLSASNDRLLYSMNKILERVETNLDRAEELISEEEKMQ